MLCITSVLTMLSLFKLFDLFFSNNILASYFNFSKLDVVKEPLELPVAKIDRPEGGITSLKLAMVGNFVPVRAQNSMCQFLKGLKDKGVNFDFYFVGRNCNFIKQKF